MNDARTAYRKLVALLCTQGLAGRAQAAEALEQLSRALTGEGPGRGSRLARELGELTEFAQLWAWLERLGREVESSEPAAQTPAGAGDRKAPIPVQRVAEPEPMGSRASVPDIVPPTPTAPESPPHEPDHVVQWAAPPLEPRVLADFFGEVSEHLEEASRIVVSVGAEDRETLQELYRKLHTVKGNCGMVGLSELQEVAHRLEDLVKRMKEGRRGPTDAERRVLAEGLQLGIAVLDLAQSGRTGTVPMGRFRAAVGALLATGVVPRTAEPGAAAVPRTVEPGGAGAHKPADGTPERSESSMSRPQAAAKASDASGGSRKTLRVDFGEVDRLALLVGEQSVRQEEALRQIARLEDRVEDVFRGLDQSGSPGDAVRTARQELGLMTSELEGTARSLDLVSGDIQRRVFDLRMVPLDALFERHRMTVYQAAVSQGKQARLIIEAGDARIDKSIAEKLDEPMIHLLRNAVSHGIAAPAERIRAGKAAEGKVTVRAFSKGSQVVVEVEDDGVGIVPSVLRRKAVEKGFLSEEESRKLDDSRVVDLIFAPGFSTTTRVDDVSGRGVGLDVVRNQVAKVGGAVELECRPGQGAVFRLTLPLTLAVARVLMVQCAGEPVALPADAVMRVETVTSGGLVEAGGRAMARIGDETLPFIRLANLLDLWDGADFRNEYTVCIVRHGDRMGALVVDRVMEHTQAVVREPGPLLPNIEHCMGVTVLEGRAVLIADVGAVLRSWSDGTWADRTSDAGRAILLVGMGAERYLPLLRSLPRRPGPVLVTPELLRPELVLKASVVAVAADIPALTSTLESVAGAGGRRRVVVVSSGGNRPGLDALYRLGVDEVVDLDRGAGLAAGSLLQAGGGR